MAQFYTDASRETDPTALPDAETFYMTAREQADMRGEAPTEDDISGWFWQACFPGCLPDGDPVGPFETEDDAIEDARA